MASQIKKLAGQTAVYGFSSIIGRFLNYLLVPLYTNLFLTSQYGIVTDLYAYAGFLFVLLTYGMETAYFRFSEKHQNSEKVFTTAISPLLITTSVFLTAIIIFAQPIANILRYPEHKEYVIWFALIISLDTLTTIPFAKLRRENKAVKFATFKFINIGLNIGFNLFFLLLCPYLIKHNPNSFIHAYYSENIGIGYIFISNLIASAVTLLLFIPDFLKTKYTFSKTILKQLLIYGSPLLFAGLAGMVNEVIDRVLLKYLIVVPQGISNANNYIFSQIGIYGANYKLSILITLFIQAFRYAAEPFFFSHAKEKNAKETYAKVMNYFIIFSLVIFLGIMLYIDIAKYFINENYWSGLKIVPILLLANLFLGVVYNLSVWYKLTDKTKYGAYIAGIGAFVTIVLNIILIPKIGYMGSAWATFFCYFTMMTVSYFWGKKHYQISYPLKKIFLYTFFALAIFFISNYVEFIGFKMYLFHTLLFLSFLLFVSIKEKIFRFNKLKK
ncbi:MAG: polysaccharide biosynthesis protein [Bacteroidetes bacterium]|nr:MAG: polysaccharide biosynthesis protein [Bacteroidota bacterium]